MSDISTKIKAFLKSKKFAVVGASEDKHKFGHKCFACYLQKGMFVYPINPKATSVLARTAYKSLSNLPEVVDSISIITPPTITEQIVEEAIALGIKNIWLQPGAESMKAVTQAEAAGINIIHSGPCILVELGYRENCYGEI